MKLTVETTSDQLHDAIVNHFDDDVVLNPDRPIGVFDDTLRIYFVDMDYETAANVVNAVNTLIDRQFGQQPFEPFVVTFDFYDDSDI
jgi:hypothetical protein